MMTDVLEISTSSDTSFDEEIVVKPKKKKINLKIRKRKNAAIAVTTADVQPSHTEPQKPVSAYALFFRDTQAAIKTENPSATFGEISKIVASMWDTLTPQAKQVYKKKTEKAKENYFQKLAEYRAIHKEEDDNDDDDDMEDDDKPLSMLRIKNEDEDHKDLPPPPKLKMAPSHIINDKTANGRLNSDNSSPPLSVIVKDDLILSESPTKLLDDSNGGDTTPPPAIQLRNIVAKSSPITFLPSKPGQVIKLLQADEAASITNNSLSKVYKVTDIIKVAQKKEVQPILQLLTEENENNNGEEYIEKDDLIPGYCKRQSCDKLASNNPQLNGDYCSFDCLVLHCRDIFDSWVSRRLITATS